MVTTYVAFQFLPVVLIVFGLRKYENLQMMQDFMGVEKKAYTERYTRAYTG